MSKVIENMKKFRSKFDDHKRIYAVAGDTEVPVRKARSVDGVLRVDETKEMFPLKEFINSFKDSCDIEILLKRYEAGDLSVMDKFMERTPEDYKDLTMIPDNINDMFNFVRDAKDKFNELPVEVKEKFDNNYEKFASSAGNKEWLEKMGYVKENPVETAGDSANNKAETSAEGL